MKTTALLSTTALVAMSLVKISAKADSSKFEGPFASVGASASSTDTDLKNSSSNIPAAAKDSSTIIAAAFTGFETSATTIIGRAAKTLADGDDYVSGEVTIGFNKAIDSKFLIGLDVTGNSGGHKASKTNAYTRSTVGGGTDEAAASISITTAAGTQTTTYEEKETYSIGIRPSYALNDQVMVYGRLGYGTTKGNLKTSYSLSTDTTANKTVSKNLDSYQLGVGAVYNIQDNYFVDLSLNYRKSEKLQNKADDSGTTATLTSVSLTSATDNLTTTADSETYGATVKFGVRF